LRLREGLLVRALTVGIVGGVDLQVLEEETVRLRDQEHQLVEDFADHVLPVLLTPLILSLELLDVGDPTQAFVLHLLLPWRHAWDEAEVRVGLPRDIACGLGEAGPVLGGCLLLGLLVARLWEVKFDG